MGNKTGIEKHINKWEQRPLLQTFKYGIVLIIIVSIFASFIGLLGFISNPLTQFGRVVSKTIDADNVIYNYEWFKKTHQDVQALERKIITQQTQLDEYVTSLPEDRKQWLTADRESYTRLQTVVSGLKNQRNDIIAEYNARSRMANRSIFKAGDIELPELIQQ